MGISGIYKIQSRIKPERCYIGSAFNIYYRWSAHLTYLKQNKHHSKKLQNHYNKYGKNDLVFSILIGCEKDDLLTTEQFFIDSYKPWFNVCPIAGNTSRRKVSKEIREKLRKKSKNRPSPNKGKRLSETHRGNISKAQMGEKNSFFNKRHTEETKRIIGEKSTQMHIIKRLKSA